MVCNVPAASAVCLLLVTFQVRPVDVRWYTKVRDHADIHVTGSRVAYPPAHTALAAIAARRAATTGQLAVKTEVRQEVKHEERPQEVKAEGRLEEKHEDILAVQAQEVSPASAAAAAIKQGPAAAAAAAAATAEVAAPEVPLSSSQWSEQQPITVKREDCRDGLAAISGHEAAVKRQSHQGVPLVAMPAPAAETVAAAAAAAGGGGGSSGGCAGGGGSAGATGLPAASSAICESCVITVRFLGYFRCHQGSGEVFDAIDLFLPDTQFETQVRRTADCTR